MPWLPKKCVIVPVDFSEESIAAVGTALQLVAGPAAIHVLHVMPAFEPTDLESVWLPTDPEVRISHARQALDERMQKEGYNGVHTDVVLGEAGHAVADFAKKQGAELIVLPSHGRTGIAHVLIGSTAERVVRLSHCPVLVLRK